MNTYPELHPFDSSVDVIVEVNVSPESYVVLLCGVKSKNKADVTITLITLGISSARELHVIKVVVPCEFSCKNHF